MRNNNMRKDSFILGVFLTFALIITSCEGSGNKDVSASDSGTLSEKELLPEEEIISPEEKEPEEVKELVWMTENLNVDKFRNGDPIPHAKSPEEWKKAGEDKQPAWCYYDNNPTNGKKYGKLYNWYAVSDKRGLAPDGWHIPSDKEWTAFMNSLGSNAIRKMKSTKGWYDNGNGTNESGFAGLPGGFRNAEGKFINIGYFGFWWCILESNQDAARYNFLNYDDGYPYIYDCYKEDGFSVRCLQD